MKKSLILSGVLFASSAIVAPPVLAATVVKARSKKADKKSAEKRAAEPAPPPVMNDLDAPLAGNENSTPKADVVPPGTGLPKPEEKAAPKEKIQPVRMSAFGSGDDVERDAAADKRREEAIAELLQIIPTFEDGEQKADLLYRLAELYWEKAKYTYFQEFRVYDEQVEQWSKKNNQGPEPALKTAGSDTMKKRAIEVYDQILKRYPDYKRNDEVLFNKANSLYEAGEKKQAIDLLAQLIRQYPNSSYVADTYLALGEHYFAANDLQKAIASYQKAVGTNKNKIYGFALYKLAWCDYNAQDYAGALQKFKTVVDYGEKQAAQKKKKKDRVQLRQEALKDMLLAFSQMDAIDEAKEYYAKKVERDELGTLLSRLAALYEDQGKYDLAVKTYKLVNGEWPYAARAPQNQAAIIQAFAAMQKREKVREEAKRLVTLYKPGGQWAQQNATNKLALSEAYDLTERSLRELTLEFHAEAQKVGKDGDKASAEKSYALARDLYREYLEAFSESENAYKMRFNYAEILFREKSYEQAAEQFDKVAATYAKGKYLKDAAFSSVQAWEMIAEGGTIDLRTVKMHRLEKGKEYPELPVPDAYQKLAAACERFVRVLPNDPDVVKVKFKEARIFFIHNHFEEAGTRFSEIIERWPNDKLGRMAATFILEGYNIREKWVELNKYARSAQKSKDLMRDESFAKEVQGFVEGSSFKIIEAEEKRGELASAGQHYRSFADEFPKSVHAPAALYNATVISDKAGQLDVAITSAEKLVRDYPDHKVREPVAFMVGSFHERTGDLEKAVKAYEAYQAKYPSGEKIQDAEYNLALFQDALGMNKQAIASYEKYLQRYPRAQDGAALYVKIGQIYERTGEGKKAYEHYSELEKRFRDAPLAMWFDVKAKMARLARQNKTEPVLLDERTIWERFTRMKGEAKQDDRIVKIAAEARFALFEPKYQEYVGLKLKLPERAMTETLVKKAKMLTEIEKEYTDILSLGNGEYGIAALARIGMAYHDFSKALYDAPVPAGLTQEQREIYQSELQSKAFPIEEKAIEAYEKTLQKAQELHIYTEWTTRAQDRLASFKPTDFPEARRFMAQPADRFVEAKAVR
jgi:tetratricopeptide (TPR) repeat protein